MEKPAEDMHADSGPPAQTPLASPPGPESRLRMRPAIARPEPLAAASPAAPIPVAEPASEEIVVTFTWVDWLKDRAVTECWALLLSLAEVPIIGFYTMLGLIAVLIGFGGSNPKGLEDIMKSPITAKVLTWFFPAGHYEGFSAAWHMGQFGLVILLVFHVLLLPVRLWKAQRPRPTYGQRVKNLLKANLIFLGAVTLLLTVSGMGIAEAIQGVAVYAFLLGFIFLPACLLLYFSTWLQQRTDLRHTGA